jgi:hypothetical protein
MGAISHMNQLYRENMKRLRSSRYNKKAGGKFTKSNTYRQYSGKLETPELSFQEKTRLRQAIKARRRIKRKRTIIAVTIGGVFVAVAIGWLIQVMSAATLTERLAEADYIEYQKEEYDRYMSYGDEFLNKSEWYNAAFEYRTSLKFDPESQEALQRLTFSLLRLCETDGRGCVEASQRLEDLEKTDFKPEVVNELRLRWEGINQDTP